MVIEPSCGKAGGSKTAPVAVVIPCYRCADTVARAVASVAAQTLRPAEVILVDDASGDGTLDVLEKLADCYGRDWIKIIAQPVNAGPGTARNAGWEKATQPFIAFLDADDAWHPAKMELQYRWMSEHPDVAMSGHGSALAISDAMTAKPPSVLPASRVWTWQMLISNRFPARSVMLRRNLPLRFQESRDYTEDYLLWLQIILSGEQAWRLEATLAYCYRPDFSPGGYSGNLWVHERRELNALRLIRREGKVSAMAYLFATAWSLIKYVRRLLLTRGVAHRTGTVRRAGA